jgi:hypothetical protein
MRYEQEQLAIQNRKLLPNQVEVFGKPPRSFLTAYTFKSDTNLQKNSKQKLAGNAAKTPNMLQKFSAFYTEIFSKVNQK